MSSVYVSPGAGRSVLPSRRGERLVISSAKELVDRFYGLSVARKAELINRFQLLEISESRLPETEKLNRALMHARDSGKLLALARAIEEIGG